jgi:hypothetical protein
LEAACLTGDGGKHQASFKVKARTVKFLGKREGNGGTPVGEPPPVRDTMTTLYHSSCD